MKYNLKIKENKNFVENFNKRYDFSWYDVKDKPFFELTNLIGPHKINNIFHFKGLQEFLWSNKDIDSKYNIIHENKHFFLEIEETKDRFPLVLGYSDLYITSDSNYPSVQETNIQELFHDFILSSLDKIFLDWLHSRHIIYSPKKLLKEALKIKWAHKSLIKESLMNIQNKYGLKIVKVTSSKGNILDSITTKTLMMPSSIDRVEICSVDWEKEFPEEYEDRNMKIQCGGSGLVISKEGNYTTAFVEVFPKKIKNGEETIGAFVRGEGSSVKEAEVSALKKLEKIKSCVNHNWARYKNRTDGYAQCTKCKLTHSALDPLTKCTVCSIPTSYGSDFKNNHYCFKHYYQLNFEDIHDSNDKLSFMVTKPYTYLNLRLGKLLVENLKNFESYSKEDFEEIFDSCMNEKIRFFKKLKMPEITSNEYKETESQFFDYVRNEIIGKL